MAGSQRASVHERRRGNAAASGYSRWVIGFARFVSYPTSPSPYPGLVPLGKRELAPSPLGTWLSMSSSTACLQLFDEVNKSDVILSVELNGKVLEEHYISNLNFSWPQMTCVSGFPPRGSRAILVTFTDSEDEIQKFALRFSACEDAVTFVVALKEKLKSLEEARIRRSEIRSEISFQSDYNPTNETISRATEEETNMVRHGYVCESLPILGYHQNGETLYHPHSTTEKEPNMVYVPEPVRRLEYHQTGQTMYPPPQPFTEEERNVVKHLGSYFPEMRSRLECHQTGQTIFQSQSASTQIPNQTFTTLPPSFTTLLSGCFPNSTLDAGKITAKQDPDLKSQILKYMEDSSFHDMLQKVERIMDEIGSNWIH